IRRIFRVREFRRMNLRARPHATGTRLLFDAQVNARSLRQRKRLERSERPLREDGIDLTDHELIVTSIGGRCIALTRAASVVRLVEPSARPVNHDDYSCDAVAYDRALSFP